MSISERINPDNLNIHQFQEVPETERPEPPFDAERDISHETRQKIIDTFMSQPHVTEAVHIRALWPTETGLERFINPQEILEAAAGDPYSQAVILPRLKMLFPNLDLGLNDNDWSRMREYIQENDKILYVALLKILDPDQPLAFSQEKLDQIKNTVEDLFVRDSWEYLKVQSCLRLIYDGYSPKITQEQWAQAQKMLQMFHQLVPQGDIGGYLLTAFELKILAAYSVKITAPGIIDIQMYPPEDLNNSTPSIPEKRKF